MAGALNYRHADKAEHNVRLDLEAAQRVFEHVRSGALKVDWVLSDVTFTSEIAITTDSPVFQSLKAGAPWAQLLAQHMQRWFEECYPHTMQHDALTLSAALGLPFVDLDQATVVLSADGRMSIRSEGVPLWVSKSARYDAFTVWMNKQLEAGLALPRFLGQRQ